MQTQKQPRPISKKASILHIAAAVVLAALLVGTWHAARTSAGKTVLTVPVNCPAGMAGVPGGNYIIGSSMKMAAYLLKFCQNTLGDCDELWFSPETLNRSAAVKPFCIDRYEYPNKKGQLPLTNKPLGEAQKFCFAARKRLCTQNEWEVACAGPEARVWSFGNQYVANACSIQDVGLSPSGAHPYCVSRFGVYDLNGNAEEWTTSIAYDEKPSDPEAARVVRGGSWSDAPIFTRCAFQDSFSPGTNNPNIGFRCCVNP